MSEERMELYYWPTLQGRGELVRLALEEANAPYVDVARLPEKDGGGIASLLAFRKGEHAGLRPFAPPILKVGSLVIAQSAVILRYLGAHLDLAPSDERARLAVEQLQLTVGDVIDEVHDTHHPLGVHLYYEDQRDAAAARARGFREARLAKWFAYFESVLGDEWLVGDQRTYADLSLFQLMCGVDYAFPKAFARATEATPKLRAHRERVAARPNIAAYLASPRRIAFNEDGVFRRYPELDG